MSLFSQLRDVFCEARILFPAEFRYSQTPDQYRFCWGVWFRHCVVGEASPLIVGQMDGIVFCFVIARHFGP